jgi:hypothetical protein
MVPVVQLQLLTKTKLKKTCKLLSAADSVCSTGTTSMPSFTSTALVPTQRRLSSEQRTFVNERTCARVLHARAKCPLQLLLFSHEARVLIFRCRLSVHRFHVFLTTSALGGLSRLLMALFTRRLSRWDRVTSYIWSRCTVSSREFVRLVSARALFDGSCVLIRRSASWCCCVAYKASTNFLKANSPLSFSRRSSSRFCSMLSLFLWNTYKENLNYFEAIVPQYHLHDDGEIWKQTRDNS